MACLLALAAAGCTSDPPAPSPSETPSGSPTASPSSTPTPTPTEPGPGEDWQTIETPDGTTLQLPPDWTVEDVTPEGDPILGAEMYLYGPDDEAMTYHAYYGGDAGVCAEVDALEVLGTYTIDSPHLVPQGTSPEDAQPVAVAYLVAGSGGVNVWIGLSTAGAAESQSGCTGFFTAERDSRLVGLVTGGPSPVDAWWFESDRQAREWLDSEEGQQLVAIFTSLRAE